MTKKGFSLIELMVVVAIIAFLAMIAIPNFMRFLAKAKRAEAYSNLHAIYAAQEAYHTEHGRYSEALAGPNSIGWKPKGYKGGGSGENFYYTYGMSAHGAEGVNYMTGKLNTAHSHLARAHADERGFIAVAAGDIDSDGEPDIITIDQDGKVEVVVDDLAQ